MFLLLFCAFNFQDDELSGLVKKLENSDFRARVKTETDIKKIMDFKMYLRLRSMTVKDVEASCRLNLIAADYQTKLLAQHQIDLRGYPRYPWISGGYGRNRGYVEYAQFLGIPCDSDPNWSDWRAATKIWLHQSMGHLIKEAFEKSKDEKDFRAIMEKGLALLQREIDAMIDNEDRYWDGKDKNPLRNSKKK